MGKKRSFLTAVILGMIGIGLLSGCGAGGAGNESGSGSAAAAGPAPAAATMSTVTAASHTQIVVSWTASAGAIGYRVYQDGTQYGDVPGVTLTVTGLTANQLYCYTVAAYDASGNMSAQSAPLCATTQSAPPPLPPATPMGFTATAFSSSQINLSWTAVAAAVGYQLYRGGTLLSTVTGTSTSDTGLTPSTQYCYTIASLDSSGGVSAQSSNICVTTQTVPPALPTGLTVTPVSTSQLNLSWTGSAGATGYKIYRAGALLTTTTATTLTDTGLSAGTSYCYMVSAYDATGSESAPTTQACASTSVIPVPTNLTATAASSTQINLSWTASAGASGYKIYRNSAFLKNSAAVAASDTGLTAVTPYCYQVTAFDASNNESAKSATVCTTTYEAPPPVPAGLSVSATSATRVDLSWTASVGASGGYKIYRDGVLLGATTATSYADTTASTNTAYVYTVSAITATGSESAQTSPMQTHTGLTVPTGLTVTVNSSTEISVAWANSGGVLVTGYKLYKSAVLLGAVTSTSVLDGGLSPNTQYCYAVSATSTAGAESARSATVCGTTQPPLVPASVDLLVSSPQLNSDGASAVTLTAVVKDNANRALPGQAVSFTSGSGLLTVTQGTTGASGTATATLGTGGDRTNRVINVTAATAGINAANTVTVTGTTLSISGAASMSFGASTPLTIFLKDSAGAGIAGKTVLVSSLKGNTLSAGPYMTDASGQAIVTVTAAVGGADKISAAAIGAAKEFDLTVNAAILAFTTPAPPPAAVTEIAIGAVQAIAVKYTLNGIDQPGVTVNFVATRGTLSSATAVTNGSGVATVNISSTNSGPVLLQASIDNGPSAQVAAEFVATAVNSVTVQANPNTIGTNSGGLTTERSLITAVVRDANDNLVKNKTVNFAIVSGASNGSLSPASAITDSSGTASTYFIAGDSASATNGVQIRASVKDTLITGTATLTVARKALFITLATGPFIKEMSDKIRYQQDYVALVTDAAGNPVQGATVVATVTPLHYLKGYYVWPTNGARWQQVFTLQAASSTLSGIPACANEDSMLNNPLYDFNGQLNVNPTSGAKEDQNGNDRLDPGNVASVTATTTDAAGHSLLSIVYAKDYAYWVDVKLEAFASLSGSTSSAAVTFYLPGLAVDYTSQSTAPPGNPSPFGVSATCFVDLTVTPVSASQMTITWQKSATAASYNVYRGGVKVSVDGTVTQNSYSDSGLTGGTQYCYEIKTVSALGAETVFTGPSTVCATTNPTPPATPTGLTATGGVVVPGTSYKVTLTWTASAGTAVYKFYRDGGTTPALSVAAPALTADDTATTLKGQTAYCYTITAMDVAGNESAKSAPYCTATPP